MALKQGVSLKTDTERLLFKHYEIEKEKRIKLEELVTDLTSKLDQLQRELQDMRERSSAPSISPRKVVVPPPEMYETDEEELARETEWVRQKSRKKRKLNKSLSPQPTNKDQEKPKVKKLPLPPPIVVENIKNYQQFYDLLLSARVNKDTFLIKPMSGENVKITTNSEDSYRAVTKLLSQNSCLWHSYENKQDRPIRVMAKNLHSSCLPDRINEDLILKGFKILNAVNKLKWKNKEPLNMWILSFQKDEDVQKIYGIKSILGCKVEIQPLKSSKLIPQCKRCQSYGHTQKYCSKEPRCVKCTGKHLTRDCTKPADIKPKCVHCGEPHPANYRGCIVAKELQNIKNKLVAKKTNVPPVQTPTVSRAIPTNVHRNITSKVSYAQIATGAQPKQLQTVNTEIDQKLNQILTLMTSFDDRLKKLESDTKKPIR